MRRLVSARRRADDAADARAAEKDRAFVYHKRNADDAAEDDEDEQALDEHFPTRAFRAELDGLTGATAQGPLPPPTRATTWTSGSSRGGLLEAPAAALCGAHARVFLDQRSGRRRVDRSG